MSELRGDRAELLHEIFAQTARHYPERIAVRLASSDPEDRRKAELTYVQLYGRASRLAHYLRQRGVRRTDRVLICLPRGLDQYMAVLGVLEAGGAYVPVDWSHPRERSLYIAGECTASVVITTRERQGDFAGFPGEIVALDDSLGDIAALEPLFRVSQEPAAAPDDPAYIIYTSGSTGRPKGVVIRHRNIVFQTWSEGEILQATRHDVIYACASLAFDMSVEEMWAAFAVGATLLVGSEALAKSIDELPDVLQAHGVTMWFPVPSLLATVDYDLPCIRLINVGGESCPPELVRRWAPGRRMINTYGPTETAVSATWAELVSGRDVTIGKPLPGFSAWVVDAELQPVRDGVEGELLIGGPGVGAGYWNDPKLTADKFVFTDLSPEPVYRSGDLVRRNPEGELEFRGRMDLQVKIRGYRVELGEIEAVLAEDPAVAQGVVNLYEEPDGSQLLTAFVTARAGQTIDTDRLRQTAARLPLYMRPDAYVVRATLPTLVSGKVNRRALERPRKLAPLLRDLEPPGNAMEAGLLDIWSGIFSTLSISTTDDFFEELGGHSLRAAHMVSRARRLPQLRGVSIQDLYAAPTIRRLAQRMAQRGGNDAAPAASFHPVPRLRYGLCAMAQGVAAIFLFAFAGLQWVFPYLAYTVISTADPSTRIPALLGAGAAFVLMPPVMIAFSIALKWLVIGRFKPGDYPLWGAYYFRWWLVRRILTVVPTNFLAGTPLMVLYFRLLGARIGRNVFLRSNDIDAPDLVCIGDGAVIGQGAMLATSCVERGLLRIGRCMIGAGASVGTMAVLGPNSRIGNGGVLEDMSALSAEVAPGEIWGGSPAVRRGMRAVEAIAPLPGHGRRLSTMLGLTMAAALLPLAVVLPIAPGLIGMIELDWGTDDYSYIALSPLLALIYVLVTCLFITAMKWLLLGRVQPGLRSIWSWFYIRFWFTQKLGELSLDLLHPLYATLYVRPWYRALGAKVGPRAEISTATSVVHDLVDIGAESFIADGVVFGADRAEPNMIRLGRTRIGRRSFIGNSALLPTGSSIGDDVLIGVLSKPPEAVEKALEAGSTWFGLPPIRLPHRQVSVQFDEGARFRPSRRLVAMRLAIEYVRITLPLTGFIAIFCMLLSIVGDLADLPHGTLWIEALFPLLYLGFVLTAGLFVVAVKWLVIGRYKPIQAPLWSLFVWRTELVTSTYENLMVPLLLEPLRGTPFINVFLRLLGCRIGRRVFTDTTDVTEFDLVAVGDDVALNEAAGLQTHLFEDRVMKVSRIEIGARAAVGSRAIVLYDSVMEDDTQLGDLSVLMKGERLPAASAWEGAPARLVQNGFCQGAQSGM